MTGSLIDWLARGMIDFAILESPSENDRLEDLPLFADRLVLVSAGTGSADHRASISFRAALHLPLILPSHHLGVRRTMNGAAAAARLETDALELAESGLGHAVLPALMLAPSAPRASVGPDDRGASPAIRAVAQRAQDEPFGRKPRRRTPAGVHHRDV